MAILRPESLQLPNGDPEEEQAVAFVAYTRGKKVLMLATVVHGPAGEEAVPE